MKPLTRSFILLAVWLILTGCTAVYLTPGGGVLVVSNPVVGINPATATPSPVVTMTPSPTPITTSTPVTIDPTPTQQSDPSALNRACNRNAYAVNVRAGAGTGFSVVTSLQPGQCEVIQETQGDWHWLCFGFVWQPEYGCTSTGYVAAWVVEVE